MRTATSVVSPERALGVAAPASGSCAAGRSSATTSVRDIALTSAIE
jgi:hypothetical protein